MWMIWAVVLLRLHRAVMMIQLAAGGKLHKIKGKGKKSFRGAASTCRTPYLTAMQKDHSFLMAGSTYIYITMGIAAACINDPCMLIMRMERERLAAETETAAVRVWRERIMYIYDHEHCCVHRCIRKAESMLLMRMERERLAAKRVRVRFWRVPKQRLRGAMQASQVPWVALGELESLWPLRLHHYTTALLYRQMLVVISSKLLTNHRSV